MQKTTPLLPGLHLQTLRRRPRSSQQKLAEEVAVDIFIIASDVKGAALHYGEPEQKFLSTVTLEDAAQYLAEGHFPPGSMGPKIEAAMQFVKNCGKRAVITYIKDIEAAVEGKAGTYLTL